MILLGASAGLRRAEIARLHSGHLIARPDGLWLRITGKGGRTRMVPVSEPLAGLLQALPSGYVFPGREDGHLSAGHVGVTLGRLLGAGWTGHKLRHRFATTAYAAERDLLAVQQLLAHSRPEVTARYTAIPGDALRAAGAHASMVD